MKTKSLFYLLFVLLNTPILTAQELLIYDLQDYEETKKVFISLSDVTPLSEEPNQEAIPPFEDEEADSALKYEYMKLSGVYRKRFLARASLSEPDKLFLYNYASGTLKSFRIQNIDVVARLNIYGGTWPYLHHDYMIGFEVGIGQLDDFGSIYKAFAFAGKEDPFVTGKMKQVIWDEMDSTQFPDVQLDSMPLAELVSYNLEEDRFTKRAAYKYESDGMIYYLRDWDRNEHDWGDARHLVVVSAKTKAVLYQGFYMDSEGESLAPLDNQWTGPLFKGKPPVVFGFLYTPYGCPSVEFISLTEKPVYINCDNRH